MPDTGRAQRGDALPNVRIAEEGTHEAIVRAGGAYAALVALMDDEQE